MIFLILIKLLAVATAFTVISKSYVDFRRHREGRTMLLFWTVLWLTTTLIVIYPLLIDKVAVFFQKQSVSLGSLVAIMFVFMLFLVYRIYKKAARIEFDLAQFTRDFSIKASKPARKKRVHHHAKGA